MEVDKKNTPKVLSRWFLKEPKPFTNKQEINKGFVIKIGLSVLTITVLFLLMLPSSQVEPESFQEKIDPKTAYERSRDTEGSTDSWAQVQGGHLYGAASASRGFELFGQSANAQGSGQNQRNLNTPMILTRGGLDSRTQLPPGSRFMFKLIEKTVLSNQAMPIMGVVTQDVIHESSIAIPKESKLLGDVSFDESSERAQVNWKSVIFPDGRQRELMAIGISGDGQAGVEGNVRSDAFKNTVGHTLTRFVGAYAEGSMTRNQTGYSEGGNDNGLKNAVAETAKDRAQDWANDLKKTRKWIELMPGTQAQAVLNAPFTFKDPGSIH